MNALRFSYLMTLFFLFILTNSSCTKSTLAKQRSFNFYTRTRLKSLDPIFANDLYSSQATLQMYEGLYNYHYLKRPVEVQPLLAKTLPIVSDDGLTVTIPIKENIYFHNDPCFPNGKGRNVTAKDFIYSWKRLANPKNRAQGFWVIKDRIVGMKKWRESLNKNDSQFDRPIEGLKAINKYTLQIKLVRPYFQLIHAMTTTMLSVVPKEAVELYGSKFDSYAVGTGAFKFDYWIRGSQLSMRKNPNYHPVYYPTEGAPGDKEKGLLVDAGKKLPLVDHILFNEIPQMQPQYLLFQQGDLDYFLASKDYIERFVEDNKIRPEKSRDGIILHLYPGADTTYVVFNTTDPILKNKKIRQAMSLAYNQETAIRILYKNMAVAANGPIPPSIDGYVGPKIINEYRKYDLEKAKKKLSEAGYANGKGLPTFTYELSATSVETRQIADFFKQQMALIGIKIRLVPNTWPQYMQKVKTKKFQIASAAWNADYPDAENFLQLFYGPKQAPGPNYSNYNNPTYDALYIKASLLPPSKERTKIYKKMQRILMEDCPWIFNLHRIRVALTHDWLLNYKHTFLFLDTMKYYRLDFTKKYSSKDQLSGAKGA